MTTEEAVRDPDTWWTTNIAETIAIGTTSNPIVGLHFNGDEYQRTRWLNPEVKGWAITIPRWTPHRDEDGEMIRVENQAYTRVVEEIERRERLQESGA